MYILSTVEKVSSSSNNNNNNNNDLKISKFADYNSSSIRAQLIIAFVYFSYTAGLIDICIFNRILKCCLNFQII